MKALIGEYSSTLDAKGRFLMPSGLRKQLPEDQQTDFVLNKGLDNCLVLYPTKVWEKELEGIQSLNRYDRKNVEFMRRFMASAAEVSLDGSDRMLIPKLLTEKIGLKKDLVLLAQIDRVEIWDKEAYDNWLANPQYDMAELAEEVMQR